MKIKLLISRVGPGISLNRGAIIDMNDAEAQRLIADGQAVEYVDTEKKAAPSEIEIQLETATAKPQAENAAKKQGKKAN